MTGCAVRQHAIGWIVYFFLLNGPRFTHCWQIRALWNDTHTHTHSVMPGRNTVNGAVVPVLEGPVLIGWDSGWVEFNYKGLLDQITDMHGAETP